MAEIYNSFKTPGTNAKSMFRWWFPDASADLEKVRAQIKEMYNGGFSGVEVAFTPQFTDFDPCGEYAWGSPRWREIIKTILQTALELPGEFKVDFHEAPHWPGTSNRIVPNDNAQTQELIGAFEKLTKTPKGICRIPMPSIKTKDYDYGNVADYIFENKYVAMTVAQVAAVDGDNISLVWDSMQDVSSQAKVETDPATGLAVWTPAGIPEHETKFGDAPKLRDRQLYYVADRAQLPASADDDDEIRPGDWLLFGLWRRGSGESVSGRQFEVFSLGLPYGPKCYTINGWDHEGPSLLPKYWEENILNDAEMVSLIKKVGATTDSCFKGGGGLGGESRGLWAESFPDDFYTVCGYDIRPYLPLIAFHDFKIQFAWYEFKYLMTADNGNDARLLEDFFKTAIWIKRSRCTIPYANWAKQYGYGLRNKSYAPLDDGSSGAMINDQAEGATLDLRMKMDNFRDIASGVHVSGKTIMAAEANADELMPYRLTFKNVCEKLNVCYAAGLNLAIFHGASYEKESSGKFSMWPGWHAFQMSFAGSWGRRHPWWPGVHYLSDYLARTQGALQAGVAKIDLLVYEPVRNSAEIIDGGLTGSDYNKLIAQGYSYDIGGEAVLCAPGCALSNGRLGYDGPAYKALILRSTVKSTLPALKQMIALAESGFPVVSVGSLPSRTMGVSGSNGITDEMICAAVTQLKAAKGFCHVNNEDELLAKLGELGVKPDLSYNAPGVVNIQRSDGKSRWFYIYNGSVQAAAISVAPGEGCKAYIADPWSGDLYRLDVTAMNLQPGAARFLVYAQNGELPEDLPEYTVPGEKIADLTDFVLQIDSWGPANDPEDPCRSKHTLLDMGKVELNYWDTMTAPEDGIYADGSESMYNVSGIGSYSTTYLSDKSQSVYLVTESDCDQIVGIYVNGVEQQHPDAVARYSKIELVAGVNEIRIELASTLRRRVNKENPFFTENDFEVMFGGNLDNPSATPAEDPAKMNRYGLTRVSLYQMQ